MLYGREGAADATIISAFFPRSHLPLVVSATHPRLDHRSGDGEDDDNEDEPLREVENPTEKTPDKPHGVGAEPSDADQHEDEKEHNHDAHRYVPPSQDGNEKV